MDIFINKTIETGIKTYLSFKKGEVVDKSNMFQCKIINLLVLIYGEINIINPYQLKDPKIFLRNLETYGLSKNTVNRFIEKIDNYDEWLHKPQTNRKTHLINEIEKIIIDMIIQKNNFEKLDEKELDIYDNYFANRDTDIQELRNLFSIDANYSKILWQRRVNKIVPLISFIEIEPELLDEKFYIKYGVTLEEAKNLSSKNLKTLNEKILYNEKNENETSGGKTNNPLKLVLTSGNGFTDTIVLLSIIATEIMIGLIIAFTLFGR